MAGSAGAYGAPVRRRLAPILTALLLLTAGCDDSVGEGTASEADGEGNDDGTTTTAPDGGDVDGGEDGATEPAVDAGTLTVLDTGTEPRAELRYTFAAGTTGGYTTTTVIDQELDGISPGAITTSVDVDVAVVEAGADQSIFTATFGEPRVETEPGTPDEITEGAAAGGRVLAGAVATLTVGNRGDVRDIDLELAEEPTTGIGNLAEQLTRSLLDSFEQQSVVLPAEPIGVGARWQVDFSVDALGVRTDMQQVFTVVGMDEAGIDLEFTLSGTFSDEADGTSTGSGTMRVEYGSFYPTMDSESRNEITAAEGVAIVQTITQSIRPR